MQRRQGAPLIGVTFADWLIKYAFAFAVAAFALVLLAGAATVIIAVRATEADQLVAQTFETLRAGRSILTAMQDAETGQRGYLLAEDAHYLEPFNKALAELPQRKAKLIQLARASGDERELEALWPLVDAKVKELQDTVDVERSGKHDEAMRIVKSNLGKDLMDQIRGVLDGFTAPSLALLSERQANAKAYRTSLLALIVFSLLAATTLAALLGRAAQQSIAQLRERTKQLEQEAERRRIAEDTLRQAQKIEAVGQLTGGIAHDFNNILTIILGNLDTLKRRLGGVRADAISVDFLTTLMRPVDFALQGARNAAQLTHRLLAFSRQQTLEPTRLDLNRTVADLTDMLQRTLGEQIKVETILAGGLWPTLADANQIENALLNLAINARDAMPNGGQLTIETGNAYLDEAYARRFGDVPPGQYVALSVTDTGTGIAPEVLQRVFEPFFTTKAHGLGSGLGLAMIHGFVKQSGGHIRIYSEVGQGTTVKIYLPRLVESEQISTVPAAKRAAIEDAPRAKAGERIVIVEDNDGVRARAKAGERIVIVEDNDGVRAYGAAALTEFGYQVTEAADAAAAMRILESGERIDLLFTDVVLTGGVNGREVAERFAAKIAKLPVLFTTGYTRNAIVHGGRLDANVHLLNKPYTQQDLVRKIRELLDARSEPS